MRTMKIVALITLFTFFVAACGTKNDSDKPTNKEAANNTNTTKPAETKPADVIPVDTKVAEAKPVPPADDNVYSHPVGGIKFKVPQGWKVQTEGDTLTTLAPDNTIAVSFWVPPTENFEQALRAVDVELDKVMKRVKPSGKPTRNTLNGMATFNQEGTAVVNGAQVEWSAHVIQAKRPVFALAVVAPELWKNHGDELLALVQSINLLN